MTSTRVAKTGLIDRNQPLRFTFDGKPYQGFAGDTITSALLANGVRVIGRSFKYHRPRSVWSAWMDEPNAIFSVRTRQGSMPNVLGTTALLEEGMEVRAVNAWPSAETDLKGGLDFFHRWLTAGFYYKSFIWPDWHLFEPLIRKMAGLGHVEPDLIENYVSDQRHDHCDLLIVGGGAAGLAAASAAASTGQSVWLVDDHPQMGGGLFRRGLPIEGETPANWIEQRVSAIREAGGRVLTSTTVFGAYDHGLYGLIEEQGFARAPTLYRLRPQRTLLATGAIDRPVTFANNDLPGIHALEAATEYLARYGVRIGQRIAVAANHSFAPSAAARLTEAGAEIVVVDPAQGHLQAEGGKSVVSLSQNGRVEKVDTVLASAGWSPLLHLWKHAGGKLDWNETIGAFLPGKGPETMRVIGAANGTFELDVALEEARAAALNKPFTRPESLLSMRAILPVPGSKGRQWIDFQHDVTLKDVELAARENFVSVEHLKRYTTLGMASDQGKTSNLPGLAAMASILGKTVPEVGTTTFRPPFVPVPMELYHGHHRGQLFHPLKRLALESRHRAAGAALGEYGGWLRPAWYGQKPGPQAAQDEVRMVRAAGGILDASPLGKIEVMGPDAEAFIDFVYYNTMRTLKPGHLRYGFLLTEKGVVYDDGVLFRLGPNRFIISCSSSHAEGVTGLLESWRQDGNDPDRIFVHDTTNHWSTVTVTGRRARDMVSTLGLYIDLSAGAFPHMTFRETAWNGVSMRIARVSFTGEVSFEMSVPASQVGMLWDAMVEAGKPLGVGPLGLEALSILRAEKGYLIIGKDTDGETMPHDLGVAIPRLKKTVAFVGDRSLHTDFANDPNRRQFVGLSVPRGAAALPVGAHAIEGEKPRSIGIVTSSYDSPTLGQPIALGLIERGTARMGEAISFWHLGKRMQATITSPVFYDQEGSLLHA